MPMPVGCKQQVAKRPMPLMLKAMANNFNNFKIQSNEDTKNEFGQHTR